MRFDPASTVISMMIGLDHVEHVARTMRDDVHASDVTKAVENDAGASTGPDRLAERLEAA